MFNKEFLISLIVTVSASASGLAFAQDADEAAADVEEVYVVGARGAELNARELERDKKAFTTIISQDDAGNFADQNVAESLQRLPGITLQRSEGEGKFVTLRGLGPGFVSVSMNGAEIANAGGGANDDEGRGFGLDSIPADLLGSIEVYKSLTPDLDLNSVAGVVNVKTISAFDSGKNTLKINAQGIYQDFAGEAKPKVILQGTNLLADGTIGIGYSLSYEERVTETYETRHHNDTLPRYITPNAPGVPASSDILLIPFEIENREEDAARERIASSLDFGFRPDESNDYYLRLTRTELTDEDIALREYYRYGQANAGSPAPFTVPGTPANTAFVDTENNIFGVVGGDLQHQFFVQEAVTTTTVASAGGKNIINNDWTLEYDYTNSEGELDKPDARRVQFRGRFLPLIGQFGKDFINGQVISVEQMADLAGNNPSDFTISSISGVGANGYLVGERGQPNLTYDNIFIEDSFRSETLDQVSTHLRKDFSEGMINFVKAGVLAKSRERNRNKDRWSIVPGDFAIGACGTDATCLDLGNSELGDFGTYAPNNPVFDHDFITLSEANRLLDATEQIARFTDPNRNDQESTKEDYVLTEDSAAAYFMTELQLSEKSTLIVGARYEQTDFSSTGNFTIRNDRFESAGNPVVLDISIPLTGTENSYSDLFPSIHYRYDMRDDVVVRAALWTAFSRPSFDQARAYAEIDGRVRLCNNDSSSPFFWNSDPDNCSDNPANLGAGSPQDVADDFVLSPDNIFRIGNPDLIAMTSANLDASISWYDDENERFMQAAFFYKDIADFVVEISGANVALNQLPISLPINQIEQFTIPSDLQLTNVNYFINGESAEIYGIELSYSEFFSEGWLNGFFVQGNLTVMDSKASVGETVRAGEIQLPEQADDAFNLTVGWENDDWNARLISNYRGKILKRVGSCTEADRQADSSLGFSANCQDWADVYHDEANFVDMKLTYQITNNIKFSFDALNLTEEEDLQYFQGNQFSGGNMLFRSETYGRAYQLGLNVKIY